jgi:hypothetical protein
MDRINRQSRIGLAIMRAKREIREDVEAGKVPSDVDSFAQLHDYVDANEYGGLTEWGDESRTPICTDEDVEDANHVQDAISLWLAKEPFKWATQRVDLAGIGPEEGWWAVFMPGVRWNGWIGFPYFDAFTTVEILEFVSDPEAGGDDYGYDWTFEDDGTLVIEDRQYRAEDPEHFEPERIEPDEDGLYSLGAYGWVWSER